VAGFLEFKNITKNFDNVPAVNNVSFSIEKGEFFALLGPSGCGKTTLLRMLAGFISPDSGSVFLDGRDITPLSPNKRQVNTIFQNYALFPHLNVWDNIAFGLKIAGIAKDEQEVRVDEMLTLIQMQDQALKKPHEISGGQKQRVAIARALVNRPQVLLLDEPLAALDLKLRQHMLMELDLIHDQVGITFLYVTHDQGEAMSLSDRIAVMNNGKLEQIGKPAEIYEAPKSSFVAAFIGDTNFFEGRVEEVIDEEYSRLSIDGFADILCYNDKKLKQGRIVNVSIRPEKFHITKENPQIDAHTNAVRAVVDDIIYLGTHTKYWVTVGEYRIQVFKQHSRYLLDEEPVTWKDEVWLYWSADDGYMLERYDEMHEELMLQPPDAVGEDIPEFYETSGQIEEIGEEDG